MNDFLKKVPDILSIAQLMQYHFRKLFQFCLLVSVATNVWILSEIVFVCFKMYSSDLMISS